MENLVNIVKSTLDFAKVLLKKDGILPPVVFMYKQDRSSIIPVKFNGDREKHAFYTSIGSACKRFGATRVVLVNDAAMRSFDSSDDYEKILQDPTEAPLTYPKSMRTEVIIVLGYDFETNSTEMLMQPYKELDGGKIEFLDPPKETFTEFESGLIDSIKDGYSRR